MIGQDEGRGRGGGQELATSTLAEIYAQQGLLERARAIYERIAQRAPDDRQVAERLEALSRAIRNRSGGASPTAGPATGAGGETLQKDRADGAPPAPGDALPDEVFEAWLRRR